MLSDLEAETGSDNALPLIEQLRQYQPGEADAILATLRFRQGRFEDAAAALEAAFADFRDQSVGAEPVQGARRGVGDGGRRSPPRSGGSNVRRRSTHRLRFARSQDERLATVANLTRLLDFNRQCRDAVTALEPRVPWSRSFLTLRLDCYRAVGDPRLGAAIRDLEEFEANEPPRLGSDRR